MIKFIAVNKRYITKSGEKHQALSNINLEIKPGEIFGIIGHSGAGKSTLIRAVNKLESIDNGEIWVDGRNINQLNIQDLNQARQNMGMIFQHFNLLDSYTVVDNILFPLKVAKKLKSYSAADTNNSLNKKLNNILELTGLTELKAKYPCQLSGGQKQRVAIARSLITDPKILLCDECTSALDPNTTKNILDLLKTINKKLNITILLITHEMEVIKAICHKVAIMSDGQIVESGDILDLYFSPKHKSTKNLLSRSLIDNLPANIVNNINNNQDIDFKNYSSYPIAELKFSEESTKEPIVTAIILKYKINFNILQAEVETIQDHIVGRLVIQLEADQNILNNIIEDLNNKKVKTEIIAYVPRIY